MVNQHDYEIKDVGAECWKRGMVNTWVCKRCGFVLSAAGTDPHRVVDFFEPLPTCDGYLIGGVHDS